MIKKAEARRQAAEGIPSIFGIGRLEFLTQRSQRVTQRSAEFLHPNLG
jgi:hypothetical protein